MLAGRLPCAKVLHSGAVHATGRKVCWTVDWRGARLSPLLGSRYSKEGQKGNHQKKHFAEVQGIKASVRLNILVRAGCGVSRTGCWEGQEEGEPQRNTDSRVMLSAGFSCLGFLLPCSLGPSEILFLQFPFGEPRLWPWSSPSPHSFISC